MWMRLEFGAVSLGTGGILGLYLRNLFSII